MSYRSCRSLFLILLVFLPVIFGLSVQKARATTITEDPQYIVVNFSDKFYFADWDAPEASWEAQVKPDLLKDILEMKNTLGTGTANRKLAWSTLLEYTDFPLDTPSDQSRYVTQVKRIMELAEAADLPVYLPLNGFQWWNEVPELWNWWDPDGNQTPGCENDAYAKVDGHAGTDPIYHCKFPKLRDPEFRQRFIKGYDPKNKWNVEWQDWETPMKLNWRNWGSGGLQLAPPPSLLDHQQDEMSYSDFQTARYSVITQAIAEQYSKWLASGKGYLFAGLTIGTEVSLNASVTKGDEFTPYGYRSIQEIICSVEEPDCGKDQKLSQTEVHELRQLAVHQYITQLSQIAVNEGIPKQRVYSHVWSEAKVGEPRYENYLSASVNLYARPTLSLYGFAQDPLSLPVLRNMLEKEGQPVWGASEFSTDKDAQSWERALRQTLENESNPAKIIDIYNWKEHKDTAAVGVIQKFLLKEAARPKLSEIIPDQETVAINPTTLSWQLLYPDDEAEVQKIILFKTKQNVLELRETPVFELNLPIRVQTWSAAEIQPGQYQWIVERSIERQNQTVVSRSVPMKIFIQRPETPVTTPNWVRTIIEIEDFLKSKSK